MAHLVAEVYAKSAAGERCVPLCLPWATHCKPSEDHWEHQFKSVGANVNHFKTLNDRLLPGCCSLRATTTNNSHSPLSPPFPPPPPQQKLLPFGLPRIGGRQFEGLLAKSSIAHPFPSPLRADSKITSEYECLVASTSHSLLWSMDLSSKGLFGGGIGRFVGQASQRSLLVENEL